MRLRLLLFLVPLLLLAQPASAATFTLHSCTLPDGSAASMTGWRYTDEEAAPFTSEAEGDHCAAGTSGGLERGFGTYIRTIDGGTNAGGGQQFAFWTLRAPGDTLIRGGLIRWSGQLNGAAGEASFQAASQVRLQGAPTSPTARRLEPQYSTTGANVEWGGGRAGYRDGSRVVSLPIDGDVRHRELVIENECTAGSVPGTRCEAEAYVRRVTLVLSDDRGPAGSAAGELLAAGPQAGVRGVRVSATDGGAGVRAVRVYLDGRLLAESALENAPASCRDAVPGNADPNEYAGGAAPCAASGEAALAVDTRQVPDGERLVRVTAVDAAGNEAPVAERSILVANAPPGPVGSPGSRPGAPACFVGADGALFNPQGTVGSSTPNGDRAGADAVASAALIVKRGRRVRGVNRRTVSFTARPELRGRVLTRTGAPVAGATLFLLVTPQGGSPTLCGAPIVTSATGRWSARLPSRQVNRTVAVVYFPQTGSDAVVVSPAVTLKVRAASLLRATPRSVRPGGRVRFAARLVGPGRLGNVVGVLEARERGTRRWRTFARVRSSADGRLRASYRFTRARRTTFAFRLVIPRQAARPYVTGASRPVSVRVR